MFTLETHNGCSELSEDVWGEDSFLGQAPGSPLIDDDLLYSDPPLSTTLFIDVCEGCSSTFSG